MTLFEYLSVAFSIVLSLAVVRLLSGLSVGFSPGRRSWPHASWLVFGLLTSAIVWWNFWSFRDVAWDFFSFLLVLILPASIYLQAVALVPDDPGSVASWRDHFSAARRRFFVALAFYFVVLFAGSWLVLGIPLLDPMRVMHVAGFGLALSGAVSNDERLQKVLPVVFLALLSIAAGVLFREPGALSP